MEDSDNKIVPEEVDFMEMTGGPGPEAANWKAPQPDSALGGSGESQQSPEKQRTLTQTTKEWFGRQKDKATIAAAGVVGAGSVATLGLAVQDLVQGNIPLGMVEWMSGWYGVTAALDMKDDAKWSQKWKKDDLEQERAEAILKEKNEQ